MFIKVAYVLHTLYLLFVFAKKIIFFIQLLCCFIFIFGFLNLIHLYFVGLEIVFKKLNLFEFSSQEFSFETLKSFDGVVNQIILTIIVLIWLSLPSFICFVFYFFFENCYVVDIVTQKFNTFQCRIVRKILFNEFLGVGIQPLELINLILSYHHKSL